VIYKQGSDLLLTPSQAAQALGMSRYALDHLVKGGQLRAILVGRVLRIPQMAIDELLRGEKPSS